MAKPTYQELQRRCEQYERRIKELEAQVRKLSEFLEESQRSGKRQAAPFSKGNRKATAKKPGRKAGKEYGRKGHRPPPPPDQIDATYEAQLPDACPACGGELQFSDIADQYQTEIPRQPIHRHFRVHVGHCTACGKRVQGRHDLQTSDALGAAASQLGPDLQATVVDLNKTVGASHGKTRQVVQSVFGIDLTRGGCAQAILRAGRRLEPVYESIVHVMPNQRFVSPDETGWRVGGEKAWLHTFAAADLVCYVIDPKRDASAAERVLGADYDGVMIHDGWSPYDQFTDAQHQQCLAHLIRRCREMLDVATRGAVRFPRAIKKLLQDALRLRDRRDANEISEHGLLIAVGKLAARRDRLLGGKRSNAANRRLANHLDKHRDELFTFLWYPGVDATNWRAEQALRPAVVNRKVWGGNRTWIGARAQSVLMTVLRTCALQGRSVLDYVSECLRCRENPPGLLPASP